MGKGIFITESTVIILYCIGALFLKFSSVTEKSKNAKILQIILYVLLVVLALIVYFVNTYLLIVESLWILFIICFNLIFAIFWYLLIRKRSKKIRIFGMLCCIFVNIVSLIGFVLELLN